MRFRGGEFSTGTMGNFQPELTEEMSEQPDHGKNFSGKDRIKPCAKSFISQVYDLLARVNRCLRPVHSPNRARRSLNRGSSRRLS